MYFLLLSEQIESYVGSGKPDLLGDWTVYEGSSLKRNTTDGVLLDPNIPDLVITNTSIRPYFSGGCTFSLGLENDEKVRNLKAQEDLSWHGKCFAESVVVSNEGLLHYGGNLSFGKRRSSQQFGYNYFLVLICPISFLERA